MKENNKLEKYNLHILSMKLIILFYMMLWLSASGRISTENRKNCVQVKRI